MNKSETGVGEERRVDSDGSQSSVKHLMDNFHFISNTLKFSAGMC
jgi:hypothetical protein